MSRETYAARAERTANPAAKALLQTMERKKTNLAISVDVTSKAEFLSIVETVAPYICLVKTHIDVVDDFDSQLIVRLQELSLQHDFLIFEDRKFADIGNTVSLQYSSGIYKIASWAHITNAHSVPGPSIINGLAKVGLPLGRGLLMLAEMSSKGALTTGSYTQDTITMAKANRDFVIGFIAQQRIGSDDDNFLILTPGVGLETKGDALGQQYRTPREVIIDSGCDVIIVGRGIYGKNNAEDVKEAALRYRDEGWSAYSERTGIHQ